MVTGLYKDVSIPHPCEYEVDSSLVEGIYVEGVATTFEPSNVQ